MAIGEISAGGTIIGGMVGQRGAPGRGISNVEKTATSGLTDTYTMSFTDNTTFDYYVENGQKGDKGDTGEKVTQVKKEKQVMVFYQ